MRRSFQMEGFSFARCSSCGQANPCNCSKYDQKDRLTQKPATPFEQLYAEMLGQCENGFTRSCHSSATPSAPAPAVAVISGQSMGVPSSPSVGGR